jgi:hypothetical protein
MKLVVYCSQTRGFDGRIFVARTVNTAQAGVRAIAPLLLLQEAPPLFLLRLLRRPSHHVSLFSLLIGAVMTIKLPMWHRGQGMPLRSSFALLYSVPPRNHRSLCADH